MQSTVQIQFKRWTMAMAVAVLLCTGMRSQAADYAPAVSFNSILNTYFDDSSGQISFRDSIVAFVPEGPFKGMVAVVDAEGKAVAKFEYFDSIMREGVFGRVKVKGLAEVKLTTPGIYTIVYLIDGKPVTRMPVRLRQTGSGDDPFNPVKTFAFDGYWRTHAYFTMTTYNDEPAPELNFWVGGIDLPEGETKDRFFAELIHDGKMVAHTKRTQGFIGSGHFKITKASLFHPHEYKRTANAELYMLSDLMKDGSYELKVTRTSDQAMIRSFDFVVKDGKFVPLKQTALDFDPHVDFILPRVVKRGANMFQLIEATWIRDGGNG